MGHNNSWNGVSEALGKQLQAGYRCKVEVCALQFLGQWKLMKTYRQSCSLPKYWMTLLLSIMKTARLTMCCHLWGPNIAKHQRLLAERITRLQQPVAMNNSMIMNDAANCSFSVMTNTAANTSMMAASAMSMAAARRSAIGAQGSVLSLIILSGIGRSAK
jgi:hypothetical protein